MSVILHERVSFLRPVTAADVEAELPPEVQAVLARFRAYERAMNLLGTIIATLSLPRNREVIAEDPAARGDLWKMVGGWAKEYEGLK